MRWPTLMILTLAGCGQSVGVIDDVALDRGSLVDHESPMDHVVAPPSDASIDVLADGSPAPSDVSLVDGDASDARFEGDAPPPHTAPFDCSQFATQPRLESACRAQLGAIPGPSTAVCCVDTCYLATTCGGDAAAPRCGASGRACGADEWCCYHRSIGRFRCVPSHVDGLCESPP